MPRTPLLFLSDDFEITSVSETPDALLQAMGQHEEATQLEVTQSEL